MNRKIIDVFIDQIEKCRKNNCSDCYKCIHSKEALINIPIIYSKPKSKPKPKLKNTDKFEHPLYDLVVEKFQAKKIK